MLEVQTQVCSFLGLKTYCALALPYSSAKVTRERRQRKTLTALHKFLCTEMIVFISLVKYLL